MKPIMNILAVIFLYMFSACSARDTTEPRPGELMEGKDVLIVYLSRTGNTEALAKIIHGNTGGKLVAVELQNPYPEGYGAIVEQVRKENEVGYLPPLKTEIDSMEKYDVVFFGFPTWGTQLPPPMKSFLDRYDLAGKTVVPFNTHAGYGVGSGFQTVKKLCPNSNVLDGYSTKGGIERDGILYVMQGDKEKEVQQDVRHWLREIGVIE